MNKRILGWCVYVGQKPYPLPNREAVIEFIAKRKGKIRGILHDGKLIWDEYRIYVEGMRRAGLV
jgi:hypothetical protein